MLLNSAGVVPKGTRDGRQCGLPDFPEVMGTNQGRRSRSPPTLQPRAKLASGQLSQAMHNSELCRPLQCTELALRFPAGGRHCRGSRPETRTAEKTPQRLHPPSSKRRKTSGWFTKSQAVKIRFTNRGSNGSVLIYSINLYISSYFIVLTWILNALNINNKNLNALNNESKRQEKEKQKSTNF